MPGLPRISIRQIAAAELTAVERALPFGYGDKHAARLARQQAGEAVYLIAWRGRRPVGHGFLKWNPDHAAIPALHGLTRCPDLEDLLVHPDLRGQGIGSALLQRVFVRARRRGFRQIGLSVGEADNPRARALYERLGFRKLPGKPFTLGGDYTDAKGQKRTWRETCIYLVKPLPISRSR